MDWEDTGKEEYLALQEKCREQRELGEMFNASRVKINDIRDRLENVLSLIRVCREALTNSTMIDIRNIVADSLYFFVEEQMKIADEELCEL
jgi:hypothetical protein